MEHLGSFAEQFYTWLSTTLFGEVPQNVWYTNNLDVIRGVTTVVMCGLVLLLGLALVVAVIRFMGRLFDFRR